MPLSVSVRGGDDEGTQTDGSSMDMRQGGRMAYCSAKALLSTAPQVGESLRIQRAADDALPLVRRIDVSDPRAIGRRQAPQEVRQRVSAGFFRCMVLCTASCPILRPMSCPTRVENR